jgi:hypothetical protein
MVTCIWFHIDCISENESYENIEHSLTLYGDVRQIEIHTAELLVPDPSPFEVEFAIAKLKSYKSPGSDQIAAELIQAGGEILRSKIHKLKN